MASESALRFGAQTDEATSLLRIVNMVRNGEASTRPEIGRLTGLGRGVVAQRVDLATQMGYLADAEYAPSSGGRAPRTLRFRGERGRILVCALGASHVRIGLAHLTGDLIATAQSEWDIARGPAETMSMVLDLVDELLAGSDPQDIWGVVVGIPGPVDFETGRPVAPPIMPGWNGFDIRRKFEQRFSAPVWVDNDVNLLAFGERERRVDTPVLDLIYVKVGSGIGAGLMSRGQIHRGANGAAGDIGHVKVSGSDEPCRCGKRGCLEAVAGGWALVRDAEEAIAGGTASTLAQTMETGGSLSPEIIARAAEDGDALGIALIQHSAQFVGGAVATLVNTFNPAVIAIGGAIAASGELFLAEVRQRVYELSLPLATRDLHIMYSVNDERESLRGGVNLAREQLFEVTFPRWFPNGRPLATAAALDSDGGDDMN